MEDELKYIIPAEEFVVNDETGKYNINRGFSKLRVWNNSIDLYVLTSKVLSSLPYEIIRLKSNVLDCYHSISRNIAEGYCRNGINEYLNFLNFALGSRGKYFSCIFSFYKAGQIKKVDHKKLNNLHYKAENELIKLTKSISGIKNNKDTWEKRY